MNTHISTNLPTDGQTAAEVPEVDASETPHVALVAQAFEEIVNGQFDAEIEDAATEPLKRVLPPNETNPKLHKVLAQSGLGGRLEMEALIEEGRVTVNDEVAHVGQRVKMGDRIEIDGRPARVRIAPPLARVLAYHKPVGEIVTHDDPENRPTVFANLPQVQGKWLAIGRLDINTEGLLLFTNSGNLAHKLMHPRFGLEREYAVRVLGALNEEEKAKLLEGITLEDGPARVLQIEDGGGEGANCWYKVTLAEGRNREVRRLFEALGHAVSRLIRIRYGTIRLPKGLRRGVWVELDEVEIDTLLRPDGSAPKGPRAPRSLNGGGRNNSGGYLRKNRGGGNGGSESRRGGGASARPERARYEDQPDPMQTSVSPNKKRSNNKRSGGSGGSGGGGGQPDPMRTSFGYLSHRPITGGGGGGGRRRGY